MVKFKYKFMRPASRQAFAVEEMQYPKMDFVSDAAACRFARLVLGHDCFAVRLDEIELQEYSRMMAKMDRVYV